MFRFNQIIQNPKSKDRGRPARMEVLQSGQDARAPLVVWAASPRWEYDAGKMPAVPVDAGKMPAVLWLRAHLRLVQTKERGHLARFFPPQANARQK